LFITLEYDALYQHSTQLGHELSEKANTISELENKLQEGSAKFDLDFAEMNNQLNIARIAADKNHRELLDAQQAYASAEAAAARVIAERDSQISMLKGKVMGYLISDSEERGNNYASILGGML